MKALSIKQPFTGLIMLGLKDKEHRTWKTDYRGDIIIHSSRIPDKEFMKEWGFKDSKFINGYILGVVNLYDIKQHGKIYAWLLKDIRPLPFPIPYSGNLGLFNIPDNIILNAISINQDEN